MDCEHKHQMPITNLGVVVNICMMHGMSVNNDICGSCKDRCGVGHPPTVELNFPRRSEAEIAAVYAVCKTCPLFLPNRECKKLPHVVHPTDIYAQNPANHCPEGHW